MRLGVLAVGLLAFGLFLALYPGPRRDLERVLALPRLSARDWKRPPLGQAVLLEGQLSEQPSQNPQGFILYFEDRFRGYEREGASKGRPIWQSQSVERPDIRVEVDGQAAPLCNREYVLRGKLREWQSEVVPTARGLFETSTLRRRGVTAGDWLVVDGVLSSESGQRCLRASAVFAGRFSDYVEDCRSGIYVLPVVGSVFGSLGALLAGVLYYFRRRTRARSA